MESPIYPRCGNCAYYMTDEDTDKNKDDGFCAIRDLFYTVSRDEKACADWTYDN